jgi:hypothetical protein
MKKLLFIILGCIIPVLSFAQLQWFPIGAEWYYRNDYGSYIHGKVLKDTVVNTLQAKVIQFEYSENGQLTQNVFAERNDTVYFFDQKNKAFVRAYNFGAKIGDTVTWITYPIYGVWADTRVEIPEIKSVVEYIDTLTVSGFKIPRYTTKHLDLYGYGSMTILKYMGGTTNVFYTKEYMCPLEDGHPCYRNGVLTCYIDTLLKFGDNCSPVNDNENYVHSLNLYPNPSRNNLMLGNVLYSTISSIVILDSTGKKVHINDNINEELSIEGLMPGVYKINISFIDGTSQSLSFIKN